MENGLFAFEDQLLQRQVIVIFGKIEHLCIKIYRLHKR